MAPSEERVEVWGTTVQLRRAGSGPPLLFLHGAGGGDEWSPVHETLAGIFTVYAPVHPGWGDDWMPEWLDGIDDLTFHYGALIEDLGLGRPVVFGVSLGGWIAAELAVHRPDLVGGLVLVDPAGFRPERPEWQLDLFNEAPEELMTKLFADPAKAMAMMPAGGVTVDFILKQYRGNAALARLMWRRGYDPALRRRASRITAPTLVFWGDKDGLFTIDHGRTVARDIPKSELVVIADAGHIPYLEQPEPFFEALWSFLGRHDLARVPTAV